MKNKKTKEYARMDLKIKVTSVNEEKKEFKFEIFFDPRRYEYKIENGEEGFLDKFDPYFIPLKELFKSIDKIDTLPVNMPPSRIENKNAYYEDRFNDLDKYYSKEYKNRTIKSAENLVFMSVDIVNSTGRSKELDLERNTLTNLLFLKEIEEIIIRYEGTVIKYVGDGLIAYFSNPNIMGKVDNSIECAVTIKTFVEDYINKFLAEKEIPKLKFRIGINHGEGCIVNIDEQDDIYGHALDIAHKIQECAGENQIAIGSKTNKLTHTCWREKLEKIDFDYKKEQMPELEDMILYKLMCD